MFLTGTGWLLVALGASDHASLGGNWVVLTGSECF